MLEGTVGSEEAARKVFENFSSSQSSTAEESSHEHSIFVEFTPYNAPQIAFAKNIRDVL